MSEGSGGHRIGGGRGFVSRAHDGAGDEGVPSRSELQAMLDSVTRPTVVDVNLYNDPALGFMVNVGEARRTVVMYGVRQPPTRPKKKREVKTRAAKFGLFKRKSAYS